MLPLPTTLSPRQRTFLTLCIALLGSAALLAGCASTQPTPYIELASSSQLRPNLQDSSGRIPYRVSKSVNWRSYANVIVDPVVIYKGPDHQFEEISERDKAALADCMQVEFAEKLKTRFNLVNAAAPNTLRVHLTLTGAKTTTRGLSTFTRFDLAGGPYNIVQAIRGKEGSFTGSVTYAVEVFDATSNALLEAYVTKQYPSPMNIGASLGTLDASMTGIRKGAEELVAQLY